MSSSTIASPTLTTGPTSTSNPAFTTVTGTALPAGLVCDKVAVDSVLNAIGVGPVNPDTWPQILRCCNGNPITIIEGSGCLAWCKPDVHSLNDIQRCLIKPNGSLVTPFTTVNCPNCTSQAGSNNGSTSTNSSASGSASKSGAASSVKPHNIGKMEFLVTSMVIVSFFTGMML